jgi:hydroxymethylglutaryl-CoA lyase
VNWSNLSQDIRIVEVGPRDGLQNEKKVLSTQTKARFIEMLAAAGLKTIETTSFVRADRIPQMADAEQLYPLVSHLAPGIRLPCLVPNLKGLEKASALGVTEIAVFTATSDTFNQKNINATVAESMERIRPVMVEAKRQGIKVRGYLSTAFGCPYEGATSVARLIDLTTELLSLGCYEVSVGDTIGVAHPRQVDSIIEDLTKSLPLKQISMHFHDTRGMAVANSLAALERGISTFDASAAGLGGCPYAVGATGNVATDDLVYLMHSLGLKTGIDADLLADAGEMITKELGRETGSKALRALLAKRKRA